MPTAAVVRIAPFIPRPASPGRTPRLRDVSARSSSCSDCGLRKLCMPVDIQDQEAKALFDGLVMTRLRLHKGDTLLHSGEKFTSLYAIRVGSCKTVTISDNGSELLSGYHLTGEIIGVEGMGGDTYGCQAIALEDTEVCVLPLERIERLARLDPAFQRRLYRLLSAAIAHERMNALMLGTMRAEQRLASFLLDLSSRHQARGYSATEFLLRLTREEIGCHLGLKLETVSRLFSRFDEEGLIQVRGRAVKLLDRIALQELFAAN